MPSPKRADLDDYFAQLPEVAVPHLTKLRELCRKGLPEAEEALHWNIPAFVQDGTRLLMLQSYKAHCWLRFPTRQFAAQREAVEDAGFEAGEGFIKLPYDQALPVALLKQLIKARRDEFEATHNRQRPGRRQPRTNDHDDDPDRPSSDPPDGQPPPS